MSEKRVEEDGLGPGAKFPDRPDGGRDDYRGLVLQERDDPGSEIWVAEAGEALDCSPADHGVLALQQSQDVLDVGAHFQASHGAGRLAPPTFVRILPVADAP